MVLESSDSGCFAASDAALHVQVDSKPRVDWEFIEDCWKYIQHYLWIGTACFQWGDFYRSVPEYAKRTSC